jgi:DNA-binding response OmpR family regulator
MTILHIEDDPVMQDVVAETLRRFLPMATFNQVTDLAAAQAFMSRQAPSMMLVDQTLPDGNGVEWVCGLNPAPSCPVVIVTGNDLASFVSEYSGPLRLSVVKKPFRPRDLADHLQALTSAI